MLAALIIQPVWTHSAEADMGRIYATDAQVSEESQKAIILHSLEEEVLILGTDLKADKKTSIIRFIPFPSEPVVSSKALPHAVGHVEERQGSPWMFPMDEVIKDMKKRCSLKPEKGPCKAICWKYFFDPESNKCKEFIWGGCDGVVPFETKEECVEVCEKK